MEKKMVLHEMPQDELLELLSSEEEKLNKMKMNHHVSPLENPKTITFTRKNVARIKTEISKRRILSNKE